MRAHINFLSFILTFKKSNLSEWDSAFSLVLDLDAALVLGAEVEELELGPVEVAQVQETAAEGAQELEPEAQEPVGEGADLPPNEVRRPLFLQPYSLSSI
ncbi:MAG: hypothetical protein AAF583_00850 [Pseudomonadota bacterium]